MDAKHTARTKAKLDHGLSEAAIALLDSLSMASEAPAGWITAKQMADYLGITKHAAVEKVNRMGWKRMLVKKDKLAPAYYYGPEQTITMQTARPTTSRARQQIKPSTKPRT